MRIPLWWKLPAISVPRFRLSLPKLALSDAIACIALGLYLVCAWIMFFSLVEPSLRGSSEWRIAADSITYERIAEGSPLLSLTENLLGPVVEASLLREHWAFAAFNTTLFICSLVLLRGVRFWPLIFWVLINPLTFSALLTLNKEIFAIASAAALWRWIHESGKRWLALTVVAGLCARWEQALVIILFFVMRRTRKRKLAIAYLLLGISMAFALLHAHIELGDFGQPSQSSVVLTELQDRGLYFAVFPLKLLIALTSQILLAWQPMLDSRRLHDLQTGLFVLGHQLCMCALLLRLGRRLRLADDTVYFTVIYTVVFCVSPLNEPRYLYPCYALWAMLASRRSIELLGCRSQPKQSQYPLN